MDCTSRHPLLQLDTAGHINRLAKAGLEVKRSDDSQPSFCNFAHHLELYGLKEEDLPAQLLPQHNCEGFSYMDLHMEINKPYDEELRKNLSEKHLGNALSDKIDTKMLQEFAKYNITPEDFEKFRREAILAPNFENLMSAVLQGAKELKKLFNQKYPDNQILTKEDFLRFFYGKSMKHICRRILSLIQDSKILTAKQNEQSESSGYLYKIKDQNNKTRGYLFGTVHRTIGQFQLTNSMQKAIAKSNSLILEIKNPAKTDKKIAKLVDKEIANQDDEVLLKALEKYESLLPVYCENWSELKSDNCYSSLTDPLQKLTFCRKQFQQMDASKLNGKLSLSLDVILRDQFKKFGKKVAGFESEEKVFSRFKNDEIQNRVNYELSPSVRKLQEENDLVKSFYAMWLKSEPMKIEPDEDLKAMMCQFEDTKEELDLFTELLPERSKIFANRILEDLTASTKRSMYAFGTGHLFDSANVIKTLEENNYIVVKC